VEPKVNKPKAFRSFIKYTILFLSAVSFICLAILVIKNAQRKQETQRLWSAEHEALHDDPIVVAFLKQQRVACPQQSQSSLWACGVLLKLDGLDQNKRCSTRQEPIFIGALEIDLMGLQWGWGTDYPMPSSSIQKYSLYIQGTKTRSWSYPVSSLPIDLPQEPIFLKYNWNTSFDDHGPEAWAQHDSMPVAFNFTNWLDKKPTETLPSQCALSTMHPRLPVSIDIVLPCDRLQDWRAILVDATKRINQGVLEVDKKAQCDKPPRSVRFSVNEFNDEDIEKLRNWILINHLNSR
jgi:hypothetical protein